MIDLGTVKPGSTIRVPFGSYAGATGASSATTGLAVGDVLIFKDGSATERASTAGFTVTADFDSRTGLNLIAIDLSDNTTAGFYAAGSEYIVMIGDVTIDSQTVRFPLARFRIGMQGATLDTTIATLSTQTSFTLAAGPAEDDALNGCVAYIHDVASAAQGGFAQIVDYVGSTRTVTLAAGTTFTAAATDNISILPPAPVLAIADGVHDEVVEGSTTFRQMLRGFAAVLLGKASGLASTTAVYRDIGDTKDRVTATVDADGNRSAVTRDLT